LALILAKTLRIIKPLSIKNGGRKTENVKSFNGTWQGDQYVEKTTISNSYAVINCD
jgi:hypothetical protein